MYRRLVMVLFLGFIAGCSSKSPEQMQAIEATRAAEQALTLAHGDEVRSLIEAYFMKSFSFPVQQDPRKRSEIETGPGLLSFGTPKPDVSLHVATSIELSEIHVLEYGSSRIRAIGCGEVFTDEVSFDGEYIRTDRPFTIIQIFVFAQRDNAWKVFTRYDFGDTKGAIRDWAYVSDEEKEAIGDLKTYIDMYWGCGLNLRK